jgi:hypothetical protein
MSDDTVSSKGLSSAASSGTSKSASKTEPALSDARKEQESVNNTVSPENTSETNGKVFFL